jgi:hypothetical protein
LMRHIATGGNDAGAEGCRGIGRALDWIGDGDMLVSPSLSSRNSGVLLYYITIAVNGYGRAERTATECIVRKRESKNTVSAI